MNLEGSSLLQEQPPSSNNSSNSSVKEASSLGKAASFNVIHGSKNNSKSSNWVMSKGGDLLSIFGKLNGAATHNSAVAGTEGGNNVEEEKGSSWFFNSVSGTPVFGGGSSYTNNVGNGQLDE